MPDQKTAGRGLTATALADKTENLSFVDSEGYVVNRVNVNFLFADERFEETSLYVEVFSQVNCLNNYVALGH